MDLTEYWIWWSLTIALGGASLIRGALAPRELLGIPVVLSVMWVYVYGYLSRQIVLNQEHLFAPEALAFAQLLACASLACLLAGWHLFRQRSPRRPAAGRTYDLKKLWRLGICWMAVGAVNVWLFASSGASFQESSAYIYLFYNVGFAGAGLCAAVCAREGVTVARLGIAAACFLGLIGPFLLGARRGPTFAGIIAIVFGYLLARRSQPRVLQIVQVVGTLACAGALMLFLVESRGVVYRGLGWNAAFEEVTLDALVNRRALDPLDNEFVNHCVQTQANRETGLYQYGTVHLAMAVNWIPRQLWPGKPQRSMGLYPEARQNFDPGFRTNLGVGGSWGAVADAFNNYAYGCFVFWFALGALTVCLFNRTQRSDDLGARMHYLGLLMSCHWFIAQSLSEAIVPGMFFQATFWFSLRYSRLRVTCPVPCVPHLPRVALPLPRI